MNPAIRKCLRSLRNSILLRTRYRTVCAGQNVYIGAGTRMRPHAVTIGDNVSIGQCCRFEARQIRIGNNVMIASNVGIVDRNAHDVRTVGQPFCATSPAVGLPTIIEDDVWIGFAAIILSGVTIDEGAIVAAGSVVVEDVPRYTIVASPKATVIGQRFDAEAAQLHRQLLREPTT